MKWTAFDEVAIVDVH